MNRSTQAGQVDGMTFFRKGMMGFLLLLLVGTQAQIALGDEDEDETYSNNPVVARVEGKPIMLDDLKNANIHETMLRLYEMQKALLRKEALELLSKKHPEFAVGEIKDVTRDEVSRFYETTNEVKSMGTLGEMEGHIREYLKGLHHAAFNNELEKKYQTAVQKGWVEDYFAPPNDFRLVAGVGTAMLWFNGPEKKSRKIFLLEFSDFQCPFCKRVQGTLKKLRKRYESDVQFGYRHFPLPFHKEASFLAEAVECAREQGKFWEFQNVVYQSEGIQNREWVIRLARNVGVKDMKGFEKCWESGRYRKRVQNDIQDGIKIGIQGTPTFIVGIYDPKADTVSGEMFSGAVSEDKFVSTIEKYKTFSEAFANKERCLDC